MLKIYCDLEITCIFKVPEESFGLPVSRYRENLPRHHRIGRKGVVVRWRFERCVCKKEEKMQFDCNILSHFNQLRHGTPHSLFSKISSIVHPK